MRKNKLARISLVLAAAILVTGFALLLLEKNNVTKFFTNSDASQATEETRPINDVAYTPATTTEQEEGNALKQSLIENSNTKAEGQGITVSFAYAGQEVQGGPLVIEAYVNGTSSGNCKLSMLKDAVSKEYTSNIVSTGGAYACSKISIPASDLSKGTYKLVMTATNGGISGSTEQQVEVSI